MSAGNNGQTPPRPDNRRIDNWRDWLTAQYVSGTLAGAVKMQGLAEPHASLGVWENAVVGAMARALLELGAFQAITGLARPAGPGACQKTPPEATPEPPTPSKTPHGPTSRPVCGAGAPTNHNGTCCTCRFWKLEGSEIDDDARRAGRRGETFFGSCRFLPPGPDEPPWPFTDEDDTCAYHRPGSTDDEATDRRGD